MVFEASLITAMLPLTAPAETGAKITLNVLVCPAVKVNGKLSPLRLNPFPVTVAWLTVTVDPPVLVNVSDRVEFLPI